MKTFLNVLYRRILYKIPLKLLLVLLAIFGILFFCFSSADQLPVYTYDGQIFGRYWGATSSTYIGSKAGKNLGIGIAKSSVYSQCIYFSGDFRGVSLAQSTSSSLSSCNLSSDTTNVLISDIGLVDGTTFCFSPSDTYNYYLCLYNSNSTGVILYDKTSGTPSYSPDTSYIGYGNYVNISLLYSDFLDYLNNDLVSIDSINSDYCFSNNLCPGNVLMTENQCKSMYGLISSNSCPSVPDCPDNPNIGTSNIFINDIFHPGAFNIVMNIPEEIDWDYAYTNSGQNFNLDVVGYNVDYEKMQSVIDLQNYKPTDKDFSNIIGVLAPYSKIIIFFVVLFSLWAMIKKPFKSKKL